MTICSNCGKDLAAEGQAWCLECLVILTAAAGADVPGVRAHLGLHHILTTPRTRVHTPIVGAP